MCSTYNISKNLHVACCTWRVISLDTLQIKGFNSLHIQKRQVELNECNDFDQASPCFCDIIQEELTLDVELESITEEDNLFRHESDDEGSDNHVDDQNAKGDDPTVALEEYVLIMGDDEDNSKPPVDFNYHSFVKCT